MSEIVRKIIICLDKRIFITGAPGLNKIHLGLSLAEQLNGEIVQENLKYKCCSVADLIKKEINKKMEPARKLEKKYKSFTYGKQNIFKLK